MTVFIGERFVWVGVGVMLLGYRDGKWCKELLTSLKLTCKTVRNDDCSSDLARCEQALQYYNKRNKRVKVYRPPPGSPSPSAIFREELHKAYHIPEFPPIPAKQLEMHKKKQLEMHKKKQQQKKEKKRKKQKKPVPKKKGAKKQQQNKQEENKKKREKSKKKKIEENKKKKQEASKKKKAGGSKKKKREESKKKQKREKGKLSEEKKNEQQQQQQQEKPPKEKKKKDVEKEQAPQKRQIRIPSIVLPRVLPEAKRKPREDDNWIIVDADENIIIGADGKIIKKKEGTSQGNEGTIGSSFNEQFAGQQPPGELDGDHISELEKTQHEVRVLCMSFVLCCVVLYCVCVCV